LSPGEKGKVETTTKTVISRDYGCKKLGKREKKEDERYCFLFGFGEKEGGNPTNTREGKEGATQKID